MKNKQTKPFSSKFSFSHLSGLSKMLVFAIIIASIGGGVLLFSSSAATITIKGRVYDTRTNKGIAGVVIFGCNSNGQVTTKSDGTWSMPAISSGYCARVLSGIPKGWTGPATNNRPEHASSHTYEEQIAGANCYHVTTCTAVFQTWDRSTDTGVDFRYTSPAPPTITSFTASPQTVTVGSSSKLTWASSDGTACNLSYGTTHVTLGGSGSTTVKPSSSTSYSIVCSNVSGSSATKSLTVTVKAVPVTKPPSTPAKKPTNGSTSTSSGSATGHQAQSDTTAPSAPTSLTAAEDTTTKTVNLSWDKSTDNIGVTGYQLERSIDNAEWINLGNNISGTTYKDQDTDFSTLYYYRVRAVDAAGNSSGYTNTQITTSAFAANSLTSNDTNITSDDNLVTVNIPSGVLAGDALCSLLSSTGILPPNINGYISIAGPYQLNCRDSSGKQIDSYGDSLTLTSQFDAGHLKNISVVQYYGQNDDSSWQQLNIKNHDKKTKVDTVDLGKFTTFSVMGKQHKTSVLLTVFEILTIIVAFVGGGIMLLRFIAVQRLRRQVEKRNEEYRHKSGGY